MNITKDSKVSFKLRSTDEVNMSNWQITHTLNTLMAANNKLEILDKINTYLSNGGEKKQIFIINDSFKFNTNYQRYFAEGNILSTSADSDLQKMIYMGTIIPMEFNKELYDLRRVFRLYKELNSNIYEASKYRFKNGTLEVAVDKFFNKGWEEATSFLYNESNKRVRELFSVPTDKTQEITEKTLKKLKSTYDSRMKIYYSNEDYKKNNNFFERFTTLSRPIVGVFDSDRRVFEILNAEQMYMNGEESEKGLKLKSITKNSPVVMTILLTGAMLGTMAYLAWRNHQVDLDVESNQIPATEEEAIDNIFGNAQGQFISGVDREKNVDGDVQELAKDIFNKLGTVTNNKKLKVEIEE